MVESVIERMPTYFFIILFTFFSDTFAVLIGQSFPTQLIWRQGSTVARGPRCPFAFFFRLMFALTSPLICLSFEKPTEYLDEFVVR